MNHASISPDGKILLAVGDEIPPHNEIRAFFAKRDKLPSNKIECQGSYPRYQWHKSTELKLLAGSEEDPCFCTAFSSSGQLCAVASQSGIITFIDISRIRDDTDNGGEIAVLKSSRPSLRPLWSGAVRSMCFSPAPWDLFAWAEDRGRVCIIDLRNNFQSKQVVELETDSPNIERVEIRDYDSTSERQLEIERRFVERHREALEAQDHLAAVSHTADYLEMAAERRRIEQDSLQSLSPTERQMIDSIGLRRSQDSHVGISEAPSVGPASINYSPNRHPDSSDWTGVPSRTPSSNIQGRSTGTASIHDFMRHRNWERSRASERSYQPRRRSSVVISNSNSNSNSPSHFNPNSNAQTNYASSRLAPIGSGTPTLSVSPSRLPSSSSEMPAPQSVGTSDPWHTISDAMGTSNLSLDTITHLRSLQSRNHERRTQAMAAPLATIDRHMEAISQARERYRAEHVDAMEAINRPASPASQYNAQLSRYYRANRADVVYDEIDREILSRRLNEPRRRTRNDEGIVTMGIGWSPDGRNL